jgi:transcriptional regulator with XRE-family HTH domain
MRRSSVLENRRRQVNPEIRESIDLSFQIVDRIHEILIEKGMRQKDLALLLGKKEAEISRWMRGTHNFTIDTVVTIERALQAPILQVIHQEEVTA